MMFLESTMILMIFDLIDVSRDSSIAVESTHWRERLEFIDNQEVAEEIRKVPWATTIGRCVSCVYFEVTLQDPHGTKPETGRAPECVTVVGLYSLKADSRAPVIVEAC